MLNLTSIAEASKYTVFLIKNYSSGTYYNEDLSPDNNYEIVEVLPKPYVELLEQIESTDSEYTSMVDSYSMVVINGYGFSREDFRNSTTMLRKNGSPDILLEYLSDNQKGIYLHLKFKARILCQTQEYQIS